MIDYNRLRKFLPYNVWSTDILGLWNEAVRLKSIVRFATYEKATENEGRYRKEVSAMREELILVCSAIERAKYQNVPLDIYAMKFESRDWLEFFIFEGITFETACLNISSLLDDIIYELEIKILEYIGIDTYSGHGIYYSPGKNYRLVEEETKSLIEIFEKLGIVVTYSIDTGGEESHERLIAEIAAWTFVKEMGKEDIDDVEQDLSDFITNKLNKAFGVGVEEVAIKGGVEYSSKGDLPIYLKTLDGTITRSVSLEIVDYPRKKILIEWIHENRKGGRTHAPRKIEETG